MAKFMCTHTFAPGQMTREKAEQIAAASQKDPNVKGERSFMNLTEGKVFCVWEAPGKQAVAAWFEKMKVPYDAIIPLEFEGEKGEVRDLTPARVHAGA